MSTAPPSINLVFSPGACSIASHILLHETGLPFTTTSISPLPFPITSTALQNCKLTVLPDVKNGAPPSLASINPKMKVPVLQLTYPSPKPQTITITESPAIFLAISQLVPERNFMGKSDLEKVRVAEWLNWISGTVHTLAFTMIARPDRLSDDEAARVGISEKGRELYIRGLDGIEAKLDGLHAVGDSFTAVDACLYVFYRWGGAVTELDMAGRYPKWTKVMMELKEREAWKKATDAEAIRTFL